MGRRSPRKRKRAIKQGKASGRNEREKDQRGTAGSQEKEADRGKVVFEGILEIPKKQITKFLRYNTIFTVLIAAIWFFSIIFTSSVVVFGPSSWATGGQTILLITLLISPFAFRRLFLKCREEIVQLLTPEVVVLVSRTEKLYGVGRSLSVFNLLKTLRLLERAPRWKRKFFSFKGVLMLWIIPLVLIIVANPIEVFLNIPPFFSIAFPYVFSSTVVCIAVYILPFGSLNLKTYSMLTGYLSLIEFYPWVTQIRDKVGGVDSISNPFRKSELHVFDGLRFNTENLIRKAVFPVTTYNFDSYYLALILSVQLGSKEEKEEAEKIVSELQGVLKNEQIREFFEGLISVETRLPKLWHLREKLQLQLPTPSSPATRRELIGWIVSAIISFTVLGIKIYLSLI